MTELLVLKSSQQQITRSYVVHCSPYPYQFCSNLRVSRVCLEILFFLFFSSYLFSCLKIMYFSQNITFFSQKIVTNAKLVRVICHDQNLRTTKDKIWLYYLEVIYGPAALTFIAHQHSNADTRF